MRQNRYKSDLTQKKCSAATIGRDAIKIAIIQFPGVNCEYETKRAVERAGMHGRFFRWNKDYKALDGFDGYILPGGFSYEDRSRSGAIASLDPVMNIIKKEAKTGKPVLGICNGAQILMEAGLVPGVAAISQFVDGESTVAAPTRRIGGLGGALTVNRMVENNRVLGIGFYNVWIYAKSEVKVFGEKMPIIKMPIAHGEGRFVFVKSLLNRLVKNRQIVFRYCDRRGKIINKFPINPNGSLYNIAGVSNPAGNVVAMMPHPERCEAGLAVFGAMKNFIQENGKTKKQENELLKCNFKIPKIVEYKPAVNSVEIFVELIITDNEAATVENTLNQIGFRGIKIKKWTHWEIRLDCMSSFREISAARVELDKNLNKKIKEIILSNELLNTNKEIPHIKINNKWYGFSVKSGLRSVKTTKLRAWRSVVNGQKYLVRYKDNSVGRSVLVCLNKMGILGVKKIKRGVVWKIEIEKERLKKVLQTNIFYNSFSQKCYKVSESCRFCELAERF